MTQEVQLLTSRKQEVLPFSYDPGRTVKHILSQLPAAGVRTQHPEI
jgi:hypothetical protein